ncbi:MAG: hypothetical protein SH817_08400 [Leptospira sp.]|nr:hypothetical protein [Leptospira sp.]
MSTNANELMMPNGEINPSAFVNDPMKKLEKLRILFPPEKYNVVMFSQFLMNALPEGITLKPQFVSVTDEDLWDEKNASEVPLKKDHVMLKSEKVINIGQAVGIRLEKVLEKEIELRGVPHLRIEYVASLRLPDGTMVQSTPTGKNLPILTKSGSVQAHIHESVDRKAKRNAIKEMLSIPTQMKRTEAQKMWVCVRAVIGDGSIESQAQIKTIQASATAATNALYSDEVVVKNEPKPITPDEFKEMIKNCKTFEEWETLRDTLAKDMFPDEITFEGLKALLGKKFRESFPNAGGGKL